jgi:hypothetical protein
MGVIPPVPDPPRYRAFTITPSGNPKPSWTLPDVKESQFPQSSLISELSDLQEKDKSSIADKIARLSGEQRASVYNVLVEVIAEDEDSSKGARDRLEVEEERREWSVCEAVRVKGSKGRTRYVRVFFVKAPVPFMDKGKERMGSEVSSRVSGASGASGASTVRRGSEVGSAVSGKGKGKEVANTSRSRSRGKEKGEKGEKEEKEKAVEKISKERRKSTREKEPSRESKGKGKEIERVEEKNIKRRSWKSRHRKKDYDDDDEEDSCSGGSDSTISLKSHTRGLRRSKPRELSHRFKSRRSEVNPLSYGKAEEAKWEPPAIIPPQYPVRGYPQPQAQANEYHIRAAYEAGQRDALAERLRNAALDRRDLPQGPSHVISFERLRPGFEEWSEESYSPGYVEQANWKPGSFHANILIEAENLRDMSNATGPL